MARAGDKTPTRWDSRIVELVRFVEKERGLSFEHPIPVRFLDDAEFVDELNRDQKITRRDREDADHYAGQLRAIGLIEGEVDLIEASADLEAAGVTGFYDDVERRMVIRGTNLDAVDVRVTVVHELTHALQDQRFGFRKLDRFVRSSGSDFALASLIEGDATHVEERYIFSLPKAERDDYFDDVSADMPAAPDRSTPPGVPPVLDLFSGAPYVFGLRFVALVAARDGIDGIDRLYADPPRTEEAIVDGAAYLGQERRVRVQPPRLGTGEERVGKPDEFGALSLYVMLASRLAPRRALAAAEGWGGDSYLAFTRAEQECLRAAFTGDSRRDTTEIRDALDAWAATMPPGAVTTDHAGNYATFTACESDGTRAPSAETLDAALEVITLRNDLFIEISARSDPTAARCIADRAATDAEIAPLFYETDLSRKQSDLVRSRLRSFDRACNR